MRKGCGKRFFVLVLIVSLVIVAAPRLASLFDTPAQGGRSLGRATTSLEQASTTTDDAPSQATTQAQANSLTMWPSLLPDSLQEDYERICDAADAGDMTASIKATSESDITKIMQAVAYTPSLFWVDTSTSYSAGPLGSIVMIKSKYDDVDDKRAQVEAACNEAIQGMSGLTTDYEKSVYLHDWLCNHVTYQQSTDESDQDAYGALVRGQCVCAGYANAYCLLMRTAGLSCQVIQGTLDGQLHAWNRVVLDGETYYTDVTGDDQNTDTPFRVWLNLTSAQMLVDHTPTDPDTMPSTDATRDNWYVHEGFVLSQPSVDELSAIVAAQTSGTIDVRCADREVYGWLCDLISSGDIGSVLDGGANRSFSFYHSEADDQMTVRFVL